MAKRFPLQTLLKKRVCRGILGLSGFLLSIGLAAVTVMPVSAEPKKNPAVSDKSYTVVIDAGHGGHDVGATDNGQKEKDINLGVAKKLAEKISAKLKNIKVVMTRDKDVYLTLQERADVANKAKGDLFISVHTNSVDKSNKNRKSVAGTSVYALGLHKDANNMAVARRENSVIELESNYEQRYSGFDPNKDESYIIFEMAQKKNLHQSIRFAKEAQGKLVSVAGRKDRGVHQAGFWVLWATSMPAVLVELDFVCNPTQADFLGSEKGQEKLAEALFEAVKNYFSNTADLISATSDTHVLAQAEEPVEKVVKQETTSSAQNARQSKRQEFSQRRRRSASSRKQSESRDLQSKTTIPVHTEKERMATVEQEMVSTNDYSFAETEKQRKEREKEEKKRKKEEEKRLKKEKKKNSKTSKVQKFQTIYRIQILASKDLLKQNNPRFQGLAPISVHRENNLYKYTYGETQTKSEIESLLKKVKAKIPDAFIVESIQQSSKK